MDMSALPEMCAQSLKVQLKDVGIQFRQIMSAHATNYVKISLMLMFIRL